MSTEPIVQRKVAAGALAGALTVILGWVATLIWPDLIVPPQVASAVTTVLSLLVGWAVPDT